MMKFSVIGLDLPLVIPPGDDAVLPCHLSPQINAQEMTIRWFKDKYQDLVHLYQDGEDRFENQMAEYKSRTTLIKDGIIAGNVSVIIHSVRPSDSGLYTCFFETGSFYEEAVIELKVAALGSEPHIYLDNSQNGGIAVVCESSGWFPEPEALWIDEDGNNMSSSTEVKVMDDSLQFHVKATYIFKGHPSTLSCWIGNHLLSERKQAAVHITDAFFQRISTCILSRLLTSASFTVLGILLISLPVYHFNEQKKRKRRASNEFDWRRAQRYAAAVTMDPDSVSPKLVLSEDGKSVRRGDGLLDLPYTPDRFTLYSAVLGRERLSSGKHYWEVEVGDKPAWDLAVCDDNVSRTEEIIATPETGFWMVRLRDGEYEALGISVTLVTPRVRPTVVGLFLDYEAGRLSVYNVDDRSLLFSFTGASFPPTLRPYFNPCSNEGGKNPWALRILPVTGGE
ncbi:butyrophilin subfamily 1 member A1-like [Lissotriton helveticus]